MFELIDRIPGVNLGIDDKLKEFRAGLGLSVDNSSDGTPLINPRLSEQEALTERLENTTTSNVNLNVNDPNNRTTIEAPEIIPGVRIGSTLGVTQ